VSGEDLPRPPGRAFLQFAEQWSARVEATLESWLPEVDAAHAAAKGGGVERLHEAMRYAVFPGGKRIRPMLALLGCRAAGGSLERALPAAAAIELLHTYSLVHDDLPCMDDDELRRGRPTCHRVYGEAMAVLVGDALLTLAFEAVATGGAAAVAVLARAAGSRGMVGGQAADLAAAGGHGAGGEAADLERVRSIHDRKTGALITASLLVGAHAGGGDPEILPVLEQYGDRIGRAFQITDDCLDLTASAENLGRSPGQDLAARKLTYPAVMGLPASRREADALIREACDLASVIGSQGGHELESAAALLQDAARFTVARGS
jgi:geranylgeranyl diphosphate synthase type II